MPNPKYMRRNRGVVYDVITITIPVPIHRRLKEYVKETGRRKSKVIAEALRQYLSSLETAET